MKAAEGWVPSLLPKTREAKECQVLTNTGKFHVSEHMTLGYHRMVNNVVVLCCSNQGGNASYYPSV